MKIKDVAEKLNVSPSTVSKWLLGTHTPSKKERRNILNTIPELLDIAENNAIVGYRLRGWDILDVIDECYLCKCVFCGYESLKHKLEFIGRGVCNKCNSSRDFLLRINLEDEERLAKENIEKQNTRIIKAKLKKCHQHMLRRCSEKASLVEKAAYYDRGVRVCAEWLGEGGFENFYEWALENNYKEDLQIDKDFKGDGKLYSPETCGFVSRQVNNARRRKAIQKSSSCRTCEYVGVSVMRDGKYFAQVVWGGKRIWGMVFNTANKAAEARNEYIIGNNLPHVVNIIS